MSTDTTETQAAINAGIALGEPAVIAPGLVSVVVPDDGTVHQIDTNAHEDKYAARPRRKTGTVRVQDSSSFIAYVSKHGLAESEIYADPAKHALVGVINAHQGTTDDAGVTEAAAGHRDHRVALDLVYTPAWLAWAKKDKVWMGQAEFAEHIEDNVLDVIVPDGATMLEVAQSFHATTGVVFKSATRLHSGEATLNYEESTGASAGEKGDLDIPTEFTLALQPYCGQQETVELQARFRYRIRGGQLHLSYALAQPDVILRDMFDGLVSHVSDNLPQPLFYGRPE